MQFYQKSGECLDFFLLNYCNLEFGGSLKDVTFDILKQGYESYTSQFEHVDFQPDPKDWVERGKIEDAVYTIMLALKFDPALLLDPNLIPPNDLELQTD